MLVQINKENDESSPSLDSIRSTFEFDFIPEAWDKRLVADIKISKSSAMEGRSLIGSPHRA